MHVVPVTFDINYLCWWRYLILLWVLYLLLWVRTGVHRVCKPGEGACD